jgi:transposase
LLQFAENLSDRRAADAVRSRIDWKYLLGLELTDSSFDASVLSEFRSRLVAGGAEEQLLDTLLALCREQKLVSARGRQRTDSTHVLGAVPSLNRLECVTETLRAALNALASAAPEWLRAHAIRPGWSAMADGLAIVTSRKARRSGAPMPNRSGAMVISCSRRSQTPMHQHGCARCRLLSCCGRSGCRISVSLAKLKP